MAFAELLATPGVTEVLEVRSTFGFLAFHGGSLERVTDVVATAAAERAGASVYAVVQPDELRRHLPSTDVGPGDSPALSRFLDHVEVAVALHGFGRAGSWTSLLLGGGNRDLAAHVGRCLAAALPDHEVVTELDRIPTELRGLHRRNPVNLPPGGGVQLELPPRVRGLTPHWAGWTGPGMPPPTEALVTALAEAASTWALVPQGERRSSPQAPVAVRE
ncbi:MAG: poly-gamma-glutamate hydrolase family protein [Actinomycetota bacterium]|nr:poly-gamma-glutamate hydrolase family protein [Actinomycetota bacterium]